MRIELTGYEARILRHRLDIPDAIVDALTDVEEGEPPYSEADVESVVDALSRSLGEGHEIDTTEAEAISPEITRDVLVDCVDGSTWVGCMKGNVSNATIGRAVATGQRLADKIAAYAKRNVEFPCH